MSDATATVAVRVAAPPERAFALFVHEIDRWCLVGAAMAREVGMWWGNQMSSLRELATGG